MPTPKSKIGICNLALAHLGADSIRSFEETNKRARMADVFFDQVRDYLLSKFDWPFFRMRKRYRVYTHISYLLTAGLLENYTHEVVRTIGRFLVIGYGVR